MKAVIRRIVRRIVRRLGPVGRFVDKLNDGIGRVIRWLALAMVLVGAGTAVVRFASGQWGFSINLTPPTEIQWYLFSIIFLLGAAYGLRHDVHVRVDVLYERLSARTRAGIDFVGGALFLLPFCAAMLYFSWRPVWSSWKIREVSPDPGGLSRWPIKALILLSFMLLAAQGIRQIVKHGAVLFGTAPEEDEDGADEAGAGAADHGVPMEPVR